VRRAQVGTAITYIFSCGFKEPSFEVNTLTHQGLFYFHQSSVTNPHLKGRRVLLPTSGTYLLIDLLSDRFDTNL
jgi:hypothetical protein